ncbi:MAG: DNA-binding response regulator [Desulfobacteraceae bacterium]|nr:MAG: DNA-binding response regulator [Desulfobacteraceae bacterium]
MNMNPTPRIKAVVADDESLLRQALCDLLERLWPELTICFQAQNGIEALQAVEEHQPDIAFLDIQMPGMTGVQVAKQIHDRCRVVFITAYDQYAVQAFETQAIDYILKPVEEKRLIQTIQRLKQSISREHGEMTRQVRQFQQMIRILETDQPPQYLRLLKVKQGADIRFIPVSDIYFFMAEDKYTTVKTFDHEYLIRTPIKDLEQQLDPDIFWKVHRSSIVNIDKIHTIKRTYTYQMIICFENMDRTVPVSRSSEHRFRYT